MIESLASAGNISAEVGEPSRQNPVIPQTPELQIPKAVWGIALVAVLIRVGVALYSHFTAEDFLIALRYAENAGAGKGLSYNPGEAVLGTTSPLYTLFLALCAWLSLPAAAIGKAANIAADGVLCLAIYRWLRSIGYEMEGKVAAFLVAVNPFQIRWAVSGMETSLVTLCGTWAWLEYSERRNLRAYIALAFLFLLRWDGLLLILVLSVAIVVRDKRLPLREMAAFGLLVAPWLLFATKVYGNPIPVSGTAKMIVYGWRGQHAMFPQLGNFAARITRQPGIALATAFSLLGIFKVIQVRITALWPPIIWAAMYLVVLISSKVLLFDWYLIPPLPVYLALCSIGFAGVVARPIARTSARRRLVMSVGLAGIGVALGTWTAAASCIETQSIEDHLRKPLGLWLREHTRSTDRIFLEPIGYIGYYSGRRILDGIGLVSPEVLPYWKRQSTAPMLDIVRAFRPEWCVLRPGELKRIRDASAAGATPWDKEYELIATFSYSPRRDREPVVFLVFWRTDLRGSPAGKP